MSNKLACHVIIAFTDRKMSLYLLLLSMFFIIFAENAIKISKMKDLNRIKVVLVEKKRTNKWLAEQMKKDAATVSKWCTNSNQPDLATLFEIARLLDVDVRELIIKSKE